MESLDLVQVIRSAVATIHPQIEAKQHRLQLDLGNEPVHVEGDSLRLTQVVGNLLANAVKYTPASGELSILLARADNKAIVVVRDNGIGMAPEVLPKVFDMFSQVQRSHAPNSGLGIGLALAKGLAALHSGSIEARSPGEGLGSEFLLTLPASVLPRSDQESAVVEATQGNPAQGLLILVADDNVDSARSWTELLRERGHSVQTAFDGESALALAESLRPHIVLLDIGMPYLNGYEVAQRIRATQWGSDAVLVAISGWGQARDRERAREVGFDHHFTKPATIEDLEPVLAATQRAKR